MNKYIDLSDTYKFPYDDFQRQLSWLCNAGPALNAENETSADGKEIEAHVNQQTGGFLHVQEA